MVLQLQPSQALRRRTHLHGRHMPARETHAPRNSWPLPNHGISPRLHSAATHHHTTRCQPSPRLNMRLQHIKVKSVNVHHSNDRIHALLQNDDDIHLLLMKEPRFGTVVTLRSDTNPLGDPQLDAPLNSMWDLHVPKHDSHPLQNDRLFPRNPLPHRPRSQHHNTPPINADFHGSRHQRRR